MEERDRQDERHRAEIEALREAAEAVRLMATKSQQRPWALLIALFAPLMFMAGLIWNQAEMQAKTNLTLTTLSQSQSTTARILSEAMTSQNDFERWMMEQYGDYRQWRRQVNDNLRITGDANERPRTRAR